MHQQQQLPAMWKPHHYLTQGPSMEAFAEGQVKYESCVLALAKYGL